MSVCGQTEEESGSEEPAGAASAAVRDMYEQKAVSKVVRVLTVLAYLLSVSLAAILLSVYYVCVWQSPKLPLANETGEEASRRVVDPPPPGYAAHHNASRTTSGSLYPTHHTRGGDSTVSEAMTSPSANLTINSLPSEPPDPSPPDPSPWELNSTNSTDSAVEAVEDLNFTTPLPLPYALNATDQR